MFGDMMFGHNRFYHQGRRGNVFQKGDLKYVILGLLKDNPRHGYDIIRELEERSRGLYKPSPGVIYPTLQMLEEMGYATSSEQEGKKVYTITEAGKQFLQEKSTKGGATERIKRRWNFGNIARMGEVMRQYHAIEQLIGQGFRRLDEEKAERIQEVLNQAYQEIDAILSE